MTDNDPSSLQLRLSNCLQTILELEPALQKLEMGHMLTKELAELKTLIGRLHGVHLAEDDVTRIEHATSSFLDELRMPMSLIEEHGAAKRQLLQ